MANLRPTQIVDKNGKNTTVHKKADNSSNGRLQGIHRTVLSSPSQNLDGVLEGLKEQIGREYFVAGSISKLINVEAVDEKEALPYLEFKVTVENNEGNAYTFFSDSSLSAMKPLQTDTSTYYSGVFLSDDFNALHYNLGTPFTARSITELISHSEQPSLRVNKEFPVLTAINSAVDSYDNSTITKLAFQDGDNEIMIELSSHNMLGTVELQPLRYKANQYHPDILNQDSPLYS